MPATEQDDRAERADGRTDHDAAISSHVFKALGEPGDGYRVVVAGCGTTTTGSTSWSGRTSCRP